MTSKVLPVAAACVLSIFMLDQQSIANDSGLKPTLGVGVGGEYFTWREADQSGATLLRETGPRGTLYLTWDNIDRGSSGFVYDLLLHGYIGDEKYDGHTQTGIPIKSNTDYLGGAGEISGGYRFKDLLPLNFLPSISVDLAAALGMDIWRRRISSTYTDMGTPVSGSEENYRIPYARLGLGLYQIGNYWSQYVQFGVKRPFLTHQEASLLVPQDCNVAPSVTDNFVLHPKGSESIYLKWQIDRLSEDNKRKVGVAFYYDSYQFNQSNTVFGQVTGCPAYQPNSHQNVFGIQAGYYFDLF